MIESEKVFWTYFFEKVSDRYGIQFAEVPYLNDGTVIVNGYIRKIDTDILFESRESAMEHAREKMWLESGAFAMLAILIDREAGSNDISLTDEVVERAVKYLDRISQRGMFRETRDIKPVGEA